MARMAVHRISDKITGVMSDEGEVVEGWWGGQSRVDPVRFPFDFASGKHDATSLYQPAEVLQSGLIRAGSPHLRRLSLLDSETLGDSGPFVYGAQEDQLFC